VYRNDWGLKPYLKLLPVVRDLPVGVVEPADELSDVLVVFVVKFQPVAKKWAFKLKFVKCGMVKAMKHFRTGRHATCKTLNLFTSNKDNN